ncbi:MAG: tetratricopeptide repeat protein [Candidatus Heimdallarchaeota archaeon]|nr:tetratricopeptide repeat protein [Candidatus Heimdallarchaeota archaeon]
MADSIPPEIVAHRNRISPELTDFIVQTLEGRFSAESSKQIGRILWNIIDDPVYETDEELRYLASKIGVITGQYDLAIKSITDTIVGTKVWGSVALFEIGEVDEAITLLQQVIENETSDNIPLIEAIFWITYLKQLIGDTENIDRYKNQLEGIFDSRNIRRIPQQLIELKDFIEGLVDLQSASNIAGIKKIEEFAEKRKVAKDQYWQLIALQILGDQQLDSTDYIASEKIFTQAKQLAENLSNIPLIGASDVGLAHVHFLKGELKNGNILAAQTVDKLQGISQYYAAKGHYIRGQILVKLGNHKLARNSLDKAHSLFKQYHDYNNTFMTLLAIADSYATTNNKEEAQEIYDKAYGQVVNIANKRQFAKALVQIAVGDYRQGNFVSAIKRTNQIETLSEEIQYQKGKTDALRIRAQIAIDRSEDIRKQIFTLLACQILYYEVGDEDSIANCDIVIAEAYTKLSDIRKAEGHLEKAKNFFLRISDSMKIAEIKELQASFDIQQGKFDEALVKLRSSYSHYSDVFDKNKRIRCLRKIADILAIKGDFKESLARYNKVLGLLSEEEDYVENVIINMNKAKVNLYLNKFEDSKENYKYVERYLIDNNLKLMLNKMYVEKGLLYIVEKNDELFEEVLSQLKESQSEISELDNWIVYLEALKKMYNEEYVEAYTSLATTIQKTLETDKLISSGILFNLILLVIEINKDNLRDPFVAQEVDNYIGLISGLVIEARHYYLRGVLFLIDLLWQFIVKGEKDYNEIVVQASEYFASTGIEEFGSFLLTIQYNISEWEGNKATTIRSILGAPKTYDSPETVLLEILRKISKNLFVEEILAGEKNILQQLQDLDED